MNDFVQFDHQYTDEHNDQMRNYGNCQVCVEKRFEDANVEDTNPEGLAPSGLPANVLTLEAFTANSVLSPVTDQMPCPICLGAGVVGDDDNTDCRWCMGSGNVPIGLHDAFTEWLVDGAWV